MLSNAEYDVSLGLLFLISDLARRVDEIEKAMDLVDKETPTENKIKADAEEIRKDMADYEKEYQKELNKKRDAKIEHLKAEIRKLEAEAGVYEDIKKMMPFPTYETIFPCYGCNPFEWR